MSLYSSELTWDWSKLTLHNLMSALKITHIITLMHTDAKTLCGKSNAMQ